MKIKLSLIALAFLASTTLFAQSTEPVDAPKKANDSEKMKTLFSGVKNPIKKIKYWGLYAAPEFQYGSIAGTMTPLSGGSAMLLLNKKLALGVAGYATVDNTFAPTSVGQTLGVAYGGGKIEYTFNPNSVFHISLPLLAGGGWAGTPNDWNIGGGNRGKGDKNGIETNIENGSSFGFVQPGLNLELNVFRFGKIFAGASYRIAMGVENNAITSTTTTTKPLTLTNTQLSGANFSVGAKIGLFDFSFKELKFKGFHFRNNKKSRKRDLIDK